MFRTVIKLMSFKFQLGTLDKLNICTSLNHDWNEIQSVRYWKLRLWEFYEVWVFQSSLLLVQTCSRPSTALKNFASTLNPQKALLYYYRDEQAAAQCNDKCAADFAECYGNCADQNCQYECVAEFGRCGPACPCGENCPGGCEGCPSPFCQCTDILNNGEHNYCMHRATAKQDYCVTHCETDTCVLDCSQVMVNDLALWKRSNRILTEVRFSEWYEAVPLPKRMLRWLSM